MFGTSSKDNVSLEATERSTHVCNGLHSSYIIGETNLEGDIERTKPQ